VDKTAGVRAIDSHAHVWSDQTLNYPFAPHDRLSPPDSPFPLEAFWQDARAAEVDGVVLTQPRIYGYDHAYLLDAAQAHPATVRIVPLVNVNRNGSVSDLRRMAAHPQTAAFRVIALGDRPADWLRSDRAAVVWDAAAQLSLPVSFLIDSPQLPLIRHVATAHPELTVIIDHMGRCTPTRQPDWSSDLYALASNGNVHIKLSAADSLSNREYPYRDMWKLMRELYAKYGPDRLLWGSDWPHQKHHGPYARSRGIVKQALVDAAPDDLDKIYHRTSARLYRFSAENR
jgi:L-fuconolactonase